MAKFSCQIHRRGWWEPGTPRNGHRKLQKLDLCERLGRTKWIGESDEKSIYRWTSEITDTTNVWVTFGHIRVWKTTERKQQSPRDREQLPFPFLCHWTKSIDTCYWITWLAFSTGTTVWECRTVQTGGELVGFAFGKRSDSKSEWETEKSYIIIYAFPHGCFSWYLNISRYRHSSKVISRGFLLYRRSWHRWVWSCQKKSVFLDEQQGSSNLVLALSFCCSSCAMRACYVLFSVIGLLYTYYFAFAN